MFVIGAESDSDYAELSRPFFEFCYQHSADATSLAARAYNHRVQFSGFFIHWPQADPAEQLASVTQADADVR